VEGGYNLVKRKIKFTILLFMIIFILSNINFVLSIDDMPLLPASYYGEITFDEEPASPTTYLTANIGDEVRGSISTYSEGEYGKEADEEGTIFRLSVNGTSADTEKTVYFCANNKRANEEVAWSSGDVRELDLTFTTLTEGCAAADEDDGGNGGGGSSSSSSVEGISTDDNVTKENITDEPEPVTEEIKETSLLPLIVGENEEISFEFKESKISNIKITFKGTVENPALTIEVSDDKPEATTEVSGNKVVYKYLSIDKNFDSINIAGVVIEFKVETIWLAENNVYPEDIILLHFKNDEWVELPTILTGLTGDSYTFEAQTDSFSYFAITIKEKNNLTTYIIGVLIIIIIGLFFLLQQQRLKKRKMKNEL